MRVTRRFHAEELDVNMTPMIDIVFQLIIFFLVVSEIISADRIANLTLPVADQARPEPKLPERLVISVNKFNQIIIGGRVRTMDDVERLLKLKKRESDGRPGDRTKQPVLIQADRHAKWMIVQDIIETANKLKFWRLSFATKTEAP